MNFDLSKLVNKKHTALIRRDQRNDVEYRKEMERRKRVESDQFKIQVLENMKRNNGKRN